MEAAPSAVIASAGRYLIIKLNDKHEAEEIMKQLLWVAVVAGMVAGFSACGDKKDSADKAAEVQKAIQEGMQKEKGMVEGMLKGAESIEKKATEQKEETKK